jgi:Leucine-rich repeat (LRR) protein
LSSSSSLPSQWQTLTISNSEDLHEHDDPDFNPSLGYNKLRQWITPRAKGITNLVFEYGFIENGPHESSETASQNFRSILKAVSPTLESLVIRSPDFEGYGFDLTWSVLKDIVGAAKTLTSLELSFINDGQLNSAHVEDLKVFKSLEKLSLTWAPVTRVIPFSAPRTEPAPAGTPPLPANLFDLKQLTRLSLNSELITGTLSKDIRKLKSLKELELKNTNISKIEALPAQLTKLSLVRSNYGQQIIDNDFWPLLDESSLREIDLSNCNITRLDKTSTPEEVAHIEYDRLCYVQKLNISNNPLGSLTQSNIIYAMGCLRELDLSNCGLFIFPEAAAETFDWLKILDLSDNRLVDLPREMECMASLKVLKARFNSFPGIPEVLKKMNQLERIDLCFSEYFEVSKSISSWLLEKKNLRKVQLAKVGGRFQASSRSWLDEAVKALSVVGRGDVLQYEGVSFL